ncbi:MAG: tRNA 2-thiocytidine biosynthesis TtcA family protein [Halanaerobiales bacterium]
MKLSLPKNYNNKVIKAVAEFDLIEKGDNILIGTSGGKDSTFLLYVMKVLQQSVSIDFEIAAVTVDLGFENKRFIQKLREYCKILEVPYYVEKTDIAEYILQKKKENPCARCSYLRKGALTNFMNRHDYNKIAYGHHYDDAVITFLMSIFYSGQLKTFQPKQFLSRNKITIIRPLVYLREKEIVAGKKIMRYDPPPGPCPFDEKSKREEVKDKFKEFLNDKQIFYNLVAAMRSEGSTELWPPPPDPENIGDKMKKFWKKSK